MQFVAAVDVIVIGDDHDKRHREVLVAEIALLIQGVGPGGDALRLDQPVRARRVAVHLHRRHLCVPDELDKVGGWAEGQPLFFAEGADVVPLVGDKVIEIALSDGGKTRRHERQSSLGCHGQMARGKQSGSVTEDGLCC